MKTILKKIRLITALAIAIAFVGCDEDDVVLPQLEAGFTHTINQDTGTVSFINTSTNADTYAWDLGDGTASTEINPIKTYPSGTYTIVLTASNVAGAEDTFEDTIVISIPEVIAFPISFDNDLVSYDATTFNGVTFQVVENPDPTGANPTVSNVGEIVNSGAAFEGFFFELGQDLDLSTDQTVEILFWSTSPVDVLLKLEQGAAADEEVTASHTGSGWETLYFTFGSTSSYSQVTFFVDGPGTTSGTFYIDQIAQINNADVPCTDTDLEIPMDFDCDGIDYATKIVGNVGFTVVDNPELSGINNVATKVGQITNNGDNFENAFFNLDVPVDFSTDNGISLKLFSNQALPILLKFEDGTTANVEDNQMHMGTGWEELTFTLNETGTYNDMVLFVAFNQTDAGTFYIDDIAQVSGSTGAACVAETTESTAAADLNITFQTDAPTVIEDNTAFSYINNPDPSGANTSCRVGQVTRFNNSPFDNIQIDLVDKLDFNASEGMKLKVWSPVANTPVLLKLEEIGNAGNFVEILQTTGAANTWTELTYDFAPTATPQFNKLVIFFNFNVGDASTYYVDDIMVYGAGGGGGGACVPETAESIAATDLNITFQTDTPALIGDNTGVSYIDNPDFAGSVNSSCRVAEVVRFNNSPFDNVQIDLTDKLDFNASEGMKMKVWSPVANTPVLLKLEEIGNAGNFVEILQTTGAANTWTELTYDFDATATPQFNKLVIFFNFNVSDGSTYYFDDLKVYGTPGGGGGGGTYSLAETIDFEPSGFGANWAWNVFENDSNPPLEFVANPSASGINTSSSVAKITALQAGQPFVGTETVHGELGITFDLDASNAIIKIMVYKTVISDVGIKLVNPSGGAQAEIKVSNTVINQWEELTFDFSDRIGNGLDGSTNIDQIVVFPDFDLGGRTQDNIIYFDNITFNSI